MKIGERYAKSTEFTSATLHISQDYFEMDMNVPLHSLFYPL